MEQNNQLLVGSAQWRSQGWASAHPTQQKPHQYALIEQAILACYSEQSVSVQQN